MRLNRLTMLLVSGTMLTASAWGQELPTTPTVITGVVDINTAVPGTMTVNTSDSAIINWNTFSIGGGGLVNFNQPTANSVVLNRVTGDTRSTIAGTLTGTGQVFIVNPNGIAITSTGVVNTAGFTASTLGISDEDFIAGNYTFEGDGSSATVSNHGLIAVESGGYAALLGGRVNNAGSIIAPLGKIGLGAAELITLDLGGDGFLKVAVPSQLDGDEPLISNSGLISADGGYVQMSVAAAKDAARNVINLSGTVEARSFSGRSGAIVLSGDGGQVTVTGTLDTSTTSAPPPRPKVQIVPLPAPRPNFRGGDITITGNALRLADADIDASGFEGGGDIRIGGDFHGNGLVPTATTLDVDFLTSITADALIDGNGGTVVLWSNDDTKFAGNISARGAGLTGRGGKVEVSGKKHLDYSGLTVTRAPSGMWGSLLLDPTNYVVYNPSSVTEAPYTAYSRINTDTIVNNLQNNGIFTINTNSAGPDAGDIVFRDSLDWSSLSDPSTLELIANRDILVELAPAGDLDGGTLGNIVMTAGRNINFLQQLFGNNLTVNAGGYVYIYSFNMAGQTTINAVGNITLADFGATSTTGIDVTSTAGGIAISPFSAMYGMSTGGIMSLRAATDMYLYAPVSANSAFLQANGTLFIQPTGQVIASTGDIIVNTGVFNNQRGVGALVNTNGGRYIVYSNDWEDDNRNDLPGSNLYNRTYATDPPNTLPGGNLFVYRRQPVVTFTIADAMRMYFSMLTSTPGVTFAGLVNGDTIDYATDGDYTAVTDTTPIDADVGTYLGALRPLNVTSAVGYAIQFVGGNLTVTPAPLTVIANNLSKIYGDTLTFNGTEFTVQGLRGTDTVNSVTLTSPGAAPTATVAGSPYAIFASNATGNGVGNYTITYVPGSLTVTPRVLTITADDLFKIFRTNLVFSGREFTAQGLVNGDTVDVASLTSPGQPMDAPVGTYPIAISGATGRGLENYAISYNPGTLLVGPPPRATTVQPTYPLTPDSPTIIGLTDPLADVLPGVLGPEISSADARVTLQTVERISQQFAAAIAECERQLEAGGDEGAYLTCASDALDAYADDLENPLIKLPPELKAAVTVIRQTAQRVRTASANPNRRAAVAEARQAVGEMVDFVKQQTALVRAVDPDTQALLQQTGQAMTQALNELDLQLVSAVEI